MKDLRDIGLDCDDVVMVHASLRKIGPVQGGAEDLISAIQEVIGHGTMIMVLGSREGDVFSAQESPADPEMGVLAEEFRKFPGTVVNDHPAARFCGLGSSATMLLRNTPLHDYYGPGSVLERLADAGGRVLRLGADPDTVTLTHFAEYLADVSPKRKVRRRYLLQGTGEQWIESLDDCEGIQDWPGGDYFSRLLTEYLGARRASKGRVGQCQAELIEAADFLRFAVSWLEKHLTRPS